MDTTAFKGITAHWDSLYLIMNAKTLEIRSNGVTYNWRGS